MDKTDLDNTPKLLEQIVSCDWMSPTAVEAELLGIKDNLHARICFKPTTNQVWVIDGNVITVRPWANDDKEDNVLREVYHYKLSSTAYYQSLWGAD